MKNIDFLPDIYRQQAAVQRARLWWGMLVVIFGAAIGSTAVGQQLLRRSVQSQLAALEPRFAVAQEQVRKLTDLHAKNTKEGDRAALVTYLEHPWPRTQLLAEVIRPLPAAIRLTELSLTEQDLPAPTGEAEAAPPPGQQADDAKKNLPPEVRDLEELRKLQDHRQTVVEIIGQVQDVTALHGYVAAVGRSPLVAKAQLKSIELVSAEEGQKETRFTLRVLVKPGYGQPGNTEETKPAGTAPTPATAHAANVPLVAHGGPHP